MGRRDLINDLNAEIKQLNAEIKKREGIIEQIKGLEDISGVVKSKKRKPGRPPGKKVKKPGRPPKNGRRKSAKSANVVKEVVKAKKTPRKKVATATGELIKDVLIKMKQPALVEELTKKVHKKHPSLGGVKYRAIISSMISRDIRFKRIGKHKVSLKK